MTIVNIREAKTHLSRLIKRAAAGEEVVIARAGTPVAQLVPLAAPAPRKPGLAKGRLTDAFFEPLPPDEQAAWRE